MDLFIQLLFCFLIGTFAGLMSGIFGIGGGSIRIPLLNLVGFPLLTAFGINLIVIPFSSSIGAITHKKNIEWRIVKYVIIGALIGSVIGAFLTGLFSSLTLAILFVITCIIVDIGIYFEKIAPKLSEKIKPTLKTLIGGLFLINLLSGMRGGSGGSLYPPFFKTMKLDIHKAIGTSLFLSIFTASAATIIYWFRGNIILLPAILVILGSLIGTRVGSLISLKTKPKWLEIGLSIFILILAIIVILKAL